MAQQAVIDVVTERQSRKLCSPLTLVSLIFPDCFSQPKAKDVGGPNNSLNNPS